MIYLPEVLHLMSRFPDESMVGFGTPMASIELRTVAVPGRKEERVCQLIQQFSDCIPTCMGVRPDEFLPALTGMVCFPPMMLPKTGYHGVWRVRGYMIFLWRMALLNAGLQPLNRMEFSAPMQEVLGGRGSWAICD